jgi:hypothetical protein
MSSRYKFSWTKRFRVPAQAFGEWASALPNRSAEMIVKAARNPKSIAHQLFEWNQSAAAHAHRLTQAREIMGSLMIEVINSKRKPENVRAFIASSDRGHYVPVLDATPTELDAEETRCVKEMERFRARWRSVQLARGVIEAIDEVRRRANRQRKAA